MSKLNVDLDLVQKYNVAGPRYTSYPPAPKFTDKLGWSDLANRVAQSQSPERDISLYFHIPFCQSLCWYCGCTTVITTQHSQGTRYLEYLEREMAQMAKVIDRRRKVVQLHFGGGTPTFLAPDELRKLGRMIRQNFNLSPQMEAGVEV